MQRIVKAVLTKDEEPYTRKELVQIAHWCTQRGHSAKKVERFMRKVAAAVLLSNRVGEVFEGIITGASDKGTYVRLMAPPAEGRVILGEEGLIVGQKVKVRLVRMVPERGYIDFQRVSHSDKRDFPSRPPRQQWRQDNRRRRRRW